MFIGISPYALTPLAVAFGVPWLIKFENLFGRSSADQDAKNGIYRYSKGSIVFSQFFIMLFAMLWFFVFPLRQIEDGSWIGSHTLTQISLLLFMWFACECLLFSLVLYMEYYTVRLNDLTLTIAAFGNRTIRYVDIKEIVVEPRARQSKRLKLTVSKGKDVTIPGSLPKFDEFVIDLRQRVYGTPDRS